MGTSSTDLARLEQELRALTGARNAAVEKARATILKANRSYDRKAVPLARRINRLREKVEAEREAEQESQLPQVSQIRSKAPKKTATAPTLKDGYSQEEIDFYNQLTKRKAS